MTFLHPSLLWALFLIAIPVIIHLFNFRIYKTVYFSNIKFLADIKDVSESKSILKNIIILILRILTIAAMVFAFSGPYIPINHKETINQEKLVCIYLDNSFSMNANSTYGNLFDASKERARKIVESYDNSQEFLFINNDFEARHRIITNKEQTNNFISQSQISPSVKNISGVISYLKEFVIQEYQADKKEWVIYLISDFQSVTSDFNQIEPDSFSTIYLLPLSPTKYNNIYIDSCWFSNVGRNLNKQEELFVRIVNKGEEEFTDIPVKLYINEKQKAVSNFDIGANQSIDFSIQYSNTESGILSCYLEISDYPVLFDNRLYFNYLVNKQTSILVINNKSESRNFSALFQNDSSFILNQVFYGNLKTSDIDNYQVVILNEPENISSGLAGELEKFVSQGGVLTLIPAANSNITELNALLTSINSPKLGAFQKQTAEIEKINFDHYLYKDVFEKVDNKLNLPSFKSYYDILTQTGQLYSILLTSSSGKPLFTQNNFEKGKVYTCFFPISEENSDFMVHPLFVPTFYNIASYSQGFENLYYMIGQDHIIDIKLKQISGEQALHVVNSSGSEDFIPYITGAGEMGLRLEMGDYIKSADNYFMQFDGKILKCISYNFNRKESEPGFYSASELQQQINKIGSENIKIIPADLEDLELQMASLHKERKDIWKIFMLLAIVFIIAEILVIRLWKETPKSKEIIGKK